MTEHEFRSNQDLRDRLNVLLQDPVLKLALEAIGDKARPRLLVAPRPHAPLDTLVAHHFHRLAGIQVALDTLRKLTEENPVVREEDDPLREPAENDFEHTLPPKMRAAIQKLRSQQP